MATITPYIGKSNDRLTAMINEDNDTSLQEDVHFTYGTVEAHTDIDGRNSKIKLTPVPGTAYKKESEVYFWRLSIGILADLPEGTLGVVEVNSYPTTIHEILPSINSAFGLTLNQEEVQDLPVSEEGADCSLIINSGSIAWLENSVYVFKTKESDKTSIADVILNSTLNGLEWNADNNP